MSRRNRWSLEITDVRILTSIGYLHDLISVWAILYAFCCESAEYPVTEIAHMITAGRLSYCTSHEWTRLVTNCPIELARAASNCNRIGLHRDPYC